MAAESNRTVNVSDMKIVYINHSDNDEKHWLHLLHTHYFTEIFYITAGKGEFLVKNQSVSVSKGSVILIPPYVEHTEVSNLDAPMVYYVVGVAGIRLRESESGAIDYLKLKDFDQQLAFCFLGAYQEWQEQQPYADSIAHDLVHILVTKISRLTMTQIYPEKDKDVSGDAFKIKNYIDNRFAESVTLDRLSDELHKSKYHLSQIFSRDYDMTISQYLQLVRFNNAKFLLRTTNYNLSDIARLTGFSSQSYLTQLFRKKEAMTPSDYRKQERMQIK